MWGDGMGKSEMGGLMWGEEGDTGQRWGCGVEGEMWGRTRRLGRRKQLQCCRVLIRAIWWLWRFLFSPPPAPPADSRMGGKGLQLPHSGNWGIGLGHGADGVLFPLSPSSSMEGPRRWAPLRAFALT